MYSTVLLMRLALLFRGEAFRWGCGEGATARQLLAIRSHHDMLVQPLNAQGHHVDVLFAFHSSCMNAGRELRAVGNGARAVDVGRSPSQADAVVRAVRWFRGAISDASIDVLMMTRFDLTLRAPLARWTCNVASAHRLSIASRCKTPNHGSPGWNCTNDIFHAVPRQYFAAFIASIGAPRSVPSAGCCFHSSCVKAGGHGCHNALVTRGVPADAVDYCWPQSTSLVSVLLPNDFFEVAQCADLPTGGAPLRPAFKGRDGTFRSGCERDRGVQNRTDPAN